jgi:hypothetical protein
LFYHELIEKNELSKAEILLTENSQINIRLQFDDRCENTKKLKYITNLPAFKHERYLQCNSKTPLRVLLKLLRNKFDISNKYQVCMQF